MNNMMIANMRLITIVYGTLFLVLLVLVYLKHMIEACHMYACKRNFEEYHIPPGRIKSAASILCLLGSKCYFRWNFLSNTFFQITTGLHCNANQLPGNYLYNYIKERQLYSISSIASACLKQSIVYLKFVSMTY